ncbi:thaumatin-like protein [Musa troglodytarum]|uniref:Thaumatin-like protein n=2 Tax=Musa troglodytarum TaxID=320322 RepID=A0A9E7K3G7_9LILI|nr:thaumatin-like protein [Musa troglodytarum]
MDSFLAPSATFLCLALLLSVFFLHEGDSTTFTFVNKCEETVWPGILSNAGSSQMQPTGFELAAAASRSIQSPTGWSGRFWARTGCSVSSTGGGAWTCATGDCGSGQVECKGSGAAPPATLAEFSLASSSAGRDFYDVSLVDGYNLPVLVEASRGCAAAGCVVDISQRCPAELRVGEACRSACDAFRKPEYCCSGAYASPATCRPTAYSEVFKAACPKSYSYAFDDPTSTFTCSGGVDYTVTFCPESAPSLKSASDSSSTSTPKPTSSSTPSSTSSSTSASTSTSTSEPAGGMMLGDDAWLASLATGDATPTGRKALFLSFSSIAATTAYILQLLP